MEKNMKIALLYDFYGDILTDKQANCIELYYNEDLSLAEISRHLNITRQGVRDNIKRGENALIKIDETLGLVDRFLNIREKAVRIDELIREIESNAATTFLNSEIKTGINSVLSIVKEIIEGDINGF